MSVLIKGMDMPKCCIYCRFICDGDSTTYCTAQRDIDNYGRETLHRIKFTYHGYDEQQSWREETCPLVGTNGYNTDSSFASDRCHRCKHYVEDKIERGLSYFYCEEDMDNFYESKEGCWRYEERTEEAEGEENG